MKHFEKWLVITVGIDRRESGNVTLTTARRCVALPRDHYLQTTPENPTPFLTHRHRIHYYNKTADK